MTDITELIEAAARVAGEHDPDDLPEYLRPGSNARLFVWDRHYASASQRRRLAEKLEASSPGFQAAVAAAERVLADDLADDNERRARVRAVHPNLFKEY